ncbi:DUF1428 domain-containing protein [Haloferula sargassicola]|uniref:Uncharacterized protein YbaA n=1 Tax=Haloferula sargassicola TaxID=490096 RepID=A0ABP9UMB5_9BACT
MSDERYTDGFLIPVKKSKLDDYTRAAEKCSAIWKEYGALDYAETVIDHDGIPNMRAFADAAGAGEDEVVVFSYVVYPSKEVRDAANEKIMADPRMKEICEVSAPLFDCRRMAYGGFRTLVRA